MNLTVHQHILIQQLRVDNVSNASVLQIGSAGIIKGSSSVYNTGGFTGEEEVTPVDVISLVPLSSPSP